MVTSKEVMISYRNELDLVDGWDIEGGDRQMGSCHNFDIAYFFAYR